MDSILTKFLHTANSTRHRLKKNIEQIMKIESSVEKDYKVENLLIQLENLDTAIKVFEKTLIDNNQWPSWKVKLWTELIRDHKSSSNRMRTMVVDHKKNSRSALL